MKLGDILGEISYFIVIGSLIGLIVAVMVSITRHVLVWGFS